MENTTPNTDNFLNWVEIKNFKSIKDLRLDCKRVNVFIGKPNVGKSNILEGLGLLSVMSNKSKMFDGYIRYKSLTDLFYDSDTNQTISVKSNSLSIYLNRLQAQTLEPPETNFIYSINNPGNNYRLLPDGKTRSLILVSDFPRNVRKYDFANLIEFDNLFQDFLLSPSGSNLYSVVRRNTELWSEFAKLFVEQQLELVLYDEKQQFILQKKDGPYVWQYPFFSIADTFRRFMFYITAIESNKNSVIIFEEPEVHSFPPYVKAMAHRIVDSEDNQFFISTHSPYLLQTLIRELDESQLSVFITYYKDYQTCVRQLTPEELQEAEDLSIDLFYNLSRYEPNA